jgi:hypothetical protein
MWQRGTGTSHGRNCDKNPRFSPICPFGWRLSRRSQARPAKSSLDLRSADAKLVTHINSLQEQLYAEKTNNRRLKGG